MRNDKQKLNQNSEEIRTRVSENGSATEINKFKSQKYKLQNQNYDLIFRHLNLHFSSYNIGPWAFFGPYRKTKNRCDKRSTPFDPPPLWNYA